MSETSPKTYPWDVLKINGEGFWFPDMSNVKAFRMYAYRYGKKHKKKFSIVKQQGAYICKRVECHS